MELHPWVERGKEQMSIAARLLEIDHLLSYGKIMEARLMIQEVIEQIGIMEPTNKENFYENIYPV